MGKKKRKRKKHEKIKKEKEKKRKNLDQMLLLAKPKLNTTEVLLPKALID